MVRTGAGSKNIFRQVEQIYIADKRHQSFGCFGIQGIRNVNQLLPNLLVVSALKKIDVSAK